eukprot:6194528-Pleurochrysis_carterae.AAC.2
MCRWCACAPSRQAGLIWHHRSCELVVTPGSRERISSSGVGVCRRKEAARTNSAAHRARSTCKSASLLFLRAQPKRLRNCRVAEVWNAEESVGTKGRGEWSLSLPVEAV